MKHKFILSTLLLASTLVGCGGQPTTAPSVEPTSETPTTSVTPSTSERDFRFQVIHDVQVYNGQNNYIFSDEEGNLVANVRRGQVFFVMFRYSPAIITMDDIVFEIEDKTVINHVDKNNVYLKNKFKAGGKAGTTTMTVYPEGEGIVSEDHTFVITFNVR